MSGPVDVLAVINAVCEGDFDKPGKPSFTDAHAARDAVAELFNRAERVTATLELPSLVKQSTKNANAGFIDWRHWMALRAEVQALRAALATVGGAK